MTAHTTITAALARNERRRIAKDDAVDKIEALETALNDLKYEARLNPFGFWSSQAALDFFRAHHLLTATDAHAEWVAEIENNLLGGEAA